MNPAFGQSPHRQFIQSPHRMRDAGTRPSATCGVVNVASQFPHHGWNSCAQLWQGGERWDYGDPAPGAYGHLSQNSGGAPVPFSSYNGNMYGTQPRVIDAEGDPHDGGDDCSAYENRWLRAEYRIRALYLWDTSMRDLVIVITRSKYTGSILTYTATVDGVGTVRDYAFNEGTGVVDLDDTDDVITGHPFAEADFYLPGYAQVASEPAGAYIEISWNANGASLSAFEPSRFSGAGATYTATLTLSDPWTMSDARDMAEGLLDEIDITRPFNTTAPYTINGVALSHLKFNARYMIGWVGGSVGHGLQKIIVSPDHTGWTDEIWTGFAYSGAFEIPWIGDQYFGQFGQVYQAATLGGSYLASQWTLCKCLCETYSKPTCLRTWAAEYCYEEVDPDPFFPITITRYNWRWQVEPTTETSCDQAGSDCVRRFTTSESSALLEPEDLLFPYGYGQLELSCHAHAAGSVCCYDHDGGYVEPYPLGHPCYRP